MLAYHCNSMIFTHRSRGSKRDFQPGTQLYKERTDFISLVRIKMKTAFDARKYSPEELNDLLGNQILVLPGLMQALYCLFDRMYNRFIYPQSSFKLGNQTIVFCKVEREAGNSFLYTGFIQVVAHRTSLLWRGPAPQNRATPKPLRVVTDRHLQKGQNRAATSTNTALFLEIKRSVTR